MELTKAGILISSLTSKILSAAKLANVSTVASNSVLAGLSSMGLTLSSNAALGQAASTLGSWLGALNGCSLLGAPAAALTSFPVGAVAVGAVPTVLGAMGFTSAGIAASSIAAKMMSVAAISNGGGVAAGSLVATLQSVGAAGLSMSSKVLLGSAGSALVSRMMGL
ncbi:interferon alpha-inducible protein 27-like protein 1 isoform X4 [Manis pentadactyla]|uniref:interferon alpha-inducible protein 27-like protein 1 isoform X4 n=1 Tax=Manis pentadactyla TaxID=143292 RepID=UPI00255CD112|nr:interferon alpha-inducible protein 27-like protein 1 isoform X4 [Manis pentadactyla]